MPRQSKQRLKDEYDKLKIRMREYGDQLDETVSENPRESVLIALGAGILIGAAVTGALMRRGR